MRSYLIPAVLMFSLIPACADYGESGDPVDEPEIGGDTQEVKGDTLESLFLDVPFIRGFVANGTGCATIGDPIIHGNSITFILTEYIAEKEGTGLARATCDIAVELNLPAGLTISLDDVIYKGFTAGLAARSTFFREYFFAGVFQGDRRFTVADFDNQGGIRISRDDSDDYLNEFGEFTALDEVLSVGASPCGAQVVWRANTSISVRNNTASSFSLTSIDTVDVTNQFFVTFNFGALRRCP